MFVQIFNKIIKSITKEQHSDIKKNYLPSIEYEEKEINEVVLTPEEKAWLKEHPAIRVMGETDYPPWDFIQNGQPAGYGIDYVKLLADRLGIDLKFDIAPYGEQLGKVQKRELDLLHTTSSFELDGVLFSKPYGRFLQMIITSDDRSDIKREEDLSGKRVAIAKGDEGIQMLKRTVPDVQTVECSGYREVLLAILDGKADAGIMDRSVANHLIRRHLLSGLAVVSEVAGARFDPNQEMRLGVRSDWPEFLILLEKAMNSITTAEMDALNRKWLRQLEKPENLKLTKSEQNWLAEHPSIRLGFNPDMQPLLIQSGDNQPTGILPDIFDQLEILTGLNISIEIAPWHETIDQARQGEIDGLASCVPALARAIGLITTKRYISTIPVVFGRKDAPFTINSLDDLKGKRVAHMRGVKFIEDILAPLVNETTVIETDSFMGALTLVLEGKADVALGMNFDTYLLNQSVLSGIRPLFIDSSLVVRAVTAVRSDWPEGVSILNKGLNALGSARINKIVGKWTQLGTSREKIALTDKERAWLRHHPVLRLGYDIDWPPVEYIDAEGRYQGMAAEYMAIIADSLDIAIEPVAPKSWQDVLVAARNGEIDILSALTPTPQREIYLLFTKPYMRFPLVIITNLDYSYISDINVLAEKEVAVVRDYASHDFLTNAHPELQLVLVNNVAEGLRAVRKGDAEAFVGSLAAVGYIMGREGVPGLKISGETAFSYQLAMGVPKGKALLAGILQKALDAISEQKRMEIFNRWRTVKYERGFDYTLLWQVLALVAVVFAAVLFWNKRLNTAVKQRTGQLRESQKELTMHRDHLEKLVEDRTRQLAFTKYAFDNAPDAIEWLRSDTAAMVYVNEQVCNLLGYSREEMLNLSVFDFDPVYHQEAWPAFREELRRKGKMAFESIWKRKDGVQFPVGISARSLNYEGEEYFIAFIQDITERKRGEAILKAAKEDAERANEKLRELDKLKSMFIASMSHELRTPLNSIIGFTGMTLDELSGDLNEEQKDNLSRAYRAAKHLLDLITDVIDISKIEAGRVDNFPENLLLSEIVEEAVGTVQHQLAEKGLQLELRMPNQIRLYTDRKRLLQCLLNFLSNAVKYSETGTVALEAREWGETVEISVRDTGIGIAAKDLPKLFEAFERFESHLRVKAGGTGLGLYLTKKIAVEILGGRVTVESEEGKGSIFTIKIPRSIDEIPQSGRGEDDEESIDH